MAIRKKSETIHLRVSPQSKLFLEGLANATKRTSTQVIEDLLADAAKNLVVENEGSIALGAYDEEELDLQTATSLAYVEGQPLLTKLRIWHLTPKLLTLLDYRIISAIVINRQYFEGEVTVFPEQQKLFTAELGLAIEAVDIAKIESHWSILEAYVRFRDDNPKWKPDFLSFVKMAESNSELK